MGGRGPLIIEPTPFPFTAADPASESEDAGPFAPVDNACVFAPLESTLVLVVPSG